MNGFRTWSPGNAHAKSSQASCEGTASLRGLRDFLGLVFGAAFRCRCAIFSEVRGILSFDGYWFYPASWQCSRAGERNRVTSGFSLQFFSFICKLHFDFGRKARPTESIESLPRRSWSQSTTNAIKTMLTEKAPSLVLVGGASRSCSKANVHLRESGLRDLSVRRSICMVHWLRSEIRKQGHSIGNCLPKTHLRESVS